mmetsp:Transcript_2395/g.5694  ORF Transcript_2395/g.5694 Transcript_2395/m.5694 type:complete len:167 (+) Transcript_2395:29-529(+)
MRDEAQITARWWSEQIDRSGLTDAHINHFRQTLEEQLLARFDGHWYPHEIKRGCGFRATVFDARMDTALSRSADDAGIPDLEERLPRAIVWCNPGEVKVCSLNDDRISMIYNGGKDTPAATADTAPSPRLQQHQRPFEVIRSKDKEDPSSGSAGNFELLDKTRNVH